MYALSTEEPLCTLLLNRGGVGYPQAAQHIRGEVYMATQPRLTFEEALMFPGARTDKYDPVPSTCVLKDGSTCRSFVSLAAKSKAEATRGVICACGGIQGGSCSEIRPSQASNCYTKQIQRED